MRVEKPSSIMKPWGREILLSCNDKYVFEIISINTGERVSLRCHEDRMETFYVLSGILRVNDNILHAGDVVTFLPREAHILKVIEHARIVEAGTPGLRDIARVQDERGRV